MMMNARMAQPGAAVLHDSPGGKDFLFHGDESQITTKPNHSAANPQRKTHHGGTEKKLAAN